MDPLIDGKEGLDGLFKLVRDVVIMGKFFLVENENVCVFLVFEKRALGSRAADDRFCPFERAVELF